MPTASRRRWRRRLAIMAAAVVAALAGWAVFAVVVIGNPARTEDPVRANAIVVLGPSNTLVPQARAMAARLGIDQLVLSIGDFREQTQTCRQPGLRVTCFIPCPYQTVGEAREIGRLAAEHEWKNVIVIAPVPQIARARMLIERCYSGTVQMVAADRPQVGWTSWLNEAVYQTGAFAKALLDQGC